MSEDTQGLTLCLIVAAVGIAAFIALCLPHLT
jgi:hypothetical protein